MYRLAIKSARYLKEQCASLESLLYTRLSYQSELVTRLPYTNRKIKLHAAGDISKAIYLDGLLGYEGSSTSLWGKLCRRADLILDIGAHIGTYSLIAADSAAGIPIHAFEPLPENFALLSENIEASGYKDYISAHTIALSNMNGETNMVVRGSSGSTLEQSFWLDAPQLNQIKVAVQTLDFWLDQSTLSITSSSLIKLDVETHEPRVLEGAYKAIGAGPAMLCEVLGTFTEEQLNDLLPAAQWRYFWIGPLGPVERRRIIGDPSWKFPNYLFIPKQSPFEADLN